MPLGDGGQGWVRWWRERFACIVVEGGFEPPVALACGGFTDRYSVAHSCHSTVVE